MAEPIRPPDGSLCPHCGAYALSASWCEKCAPCFRDDVIDLQAENERLKATNAQALAALEKVLPFLRSERQWEMQYESGEEVCGYPTPVGPVLDEVEATLAALKGGGR